MEGFDLQVCHAANLDFSADACYPNVAGKTKKLSAASSQPGRCAESVVHKSR
jgi:hypothetical protein